MTLGVKKSFLFIFCKSIGNKCGFLYGPKLADFPAGLYAVRSVSALPVHENPGLCNAGKWEGGQPSARGGAPDPRGCLEPLSPLCPLLGVTTASPSGVQVTL